MLAQVSPRGLRALEGNGLQRGDDAHGDKRGARRDPVAVAENADASEGPAEDGTPEGGTQTIQVRQVFACLYSD